MKFKHNPVLTSQIMKIADKIPPGGTIVDCTLGGGGHLELLVENANKPSLIIGIDRDLDAIAWNKNRNWPCPSHFIHSPFSKFRQIMNQLSLGEVYFVLADFGVSSHQLDTAHRGFSFSKDGPLDMRMDQKQKLTLADKFKSVDYQELKFILKKYGEEKEAARIAKALLHDFQTGKIKTTNELAQIVRRVKKQKQPGLNAATKTFQALRIWVNEELIEIEKLLETVPEFLAPGGIFAAITFHSLEDRLVKNCFTQLAHPENDIPSGIPLTKSQLPQSLYLTKGPIKPEQSEIKENPRSRSAKLRYLQRKEEKANEQ
ncbi:MAG: 16S rRNA (cytosine(1402)-N(4))-methyltransferase RsmH [Deltaproteobacteria bacterium]|nr:16S rRNA (cytosine(1402)-N(4))-methyltransferase RsmH [Deltaproteobacteria bacterium]